MTPKTFQIAALCLLILGFTVRVHVGQETGEARDGGVTAADAPGAEVQPEVPAAEGAEETPTESAEQTPDTPEGEAAAEAKQGPLPTIVRPYEVKLLVSVAGVPTFALGADERLAMQAGERLQMQFRQMWNLQTEVARNENYLSASALRTLQSEAVTERLLALEVDKVFLAAVSETFGKYTVDVREWDQSSQTLSSVHQFMVYDRRELPIKLAEAVTGAFRPLAELETLNGETVEFLVRAGELYPRDLDVMQFQQGDFLTPFMRYLNRKREVQRITEVPWTYLRVEEITRSRIRTHMTSAFGTPIPLSRRRTEIMAMRIQPHLPVTEIKIFPRGKADNPLVGVRCELMNRLPTTEDLVEDRFKTTTDRRGYVTVPVNAEHPLQYLVVYSGQSTLAKVPFIPGDRPYLEVEVPDDSARLYVEGEVSLLQTELVDIVATREVLIARATAAAKKKSWSDVDRFLNDLGKLPTLDQFEDRIETLRVPAVYAAQQAKDRAAEARVKKLCSDVLDSAKKYLNPFRIAEFRREMNSLRNE